MLTKGDLAAIQKMFDSSKKETNKRFDAVDEKFNAVDERFNAVDGKFKSIDERFDTVDERLNSLDKKFNAMDDKINGLSNKLDTNTKDLTDLILGGFSTHEPILSNHEQRITRLEKTAFKTN